MVHTYKAYQYRLRKIVGSKHTKGMRVRKGTG